MTTSEPSFEAIHRELLERLRQTEQRTRALESLVLRGDDALLRPAAPLDQTPTPGGVETPWLLPRVKQSPSERSSEAVLSAVIASQDDVIWSLSPEGDRIYLLAGGVEHTLGRPAADFLERPELWFEIIRDEDRETLHAAFRQLPLTGRFQVEFSIRNAAGSVRKLSSRGKLVRSRDRQPLRVDGITSDVSTRQEAAAIRELEARLAAAETRTHETHLETAGRLLAGAAHDLNHFLTLVTGHAELVRENLMAHDPLCESVELIASSGHSAARVARQLIAYARPSTAEPTVIDPNGVLRDSETLLRRFTGESIELDLLLTPGIAPIRIDRSEFDRVVLNLVVNARDAIEESGMIAVRTAMAAVAAGRRGWPSECPPGDYIALTVTDTGCGMTEEVQARAFTRFFTTKGSQGTGLGLAAVREIVTAAGGHVELESSLQWGTSVRVFWPAAGEQDRPITH